MKRKRETVQTDPQARKRYQSEKATQTSAIEAIYPRTCSLRQFLLSRLPRTSKLRHKCLSTLNNTEAPYAGLLDTAVIGISRDPSPGVLDRRRQQFVTFTQTQRSPDVFGDGRAKYQFSEIIDYVVWSLFQAESTASRAPDHALCHGYSRMNAAWSREGEPNHVLVPGIVKSHADPNADILRGEPWSLIYSLLGRDGEAIMCSLLLDCGIFLELEHGRGNYYQISGIPIHRVQQAQQIRKDHAHRISSDISTSSSPVRSPGMIQIVRNRIFYARYSVNTTGKVRLGMKHIHALNRYCDLDQPQQDVRMIQYLFPRQFGLHNVFTSKVDPNETTQPFKDYTMREPELDGRCSVKRNGLPRRLRTSVRTLVFQLRRNHRRCPYTQLLRYYCPTDGSTRHADLDTDVLSTSFSVSGRLTQPSLRTLTRSSRSQASSRASQPQKSSFLAYATPIHQVSCFCKAVFRHLLPWNSFGIGSDGDSNWKIVLGSVDRFLSMRRFETITLHEISHRLSLKAIDWLRPDHINSRAKLSSSDRQKRLELLNEFLYYVFDSLLIPLVRSNFYVTETGTHRNRLYYFRQDVWRRLAEPCLMNLRMDTFKPINSRQLPYVLQSSKLGPSQIRLLPKVSGARPITNLRRRSMKMLNGKQVLGPSVNAQLAPIFSILNLEKTSRPEQLGSAIFSIGEVHDKIKGFQQRWILKGSPLLFFVKVDIRACFDTIPQAKLFTLISILVREGVYRTNKHAEVKKWPITTKKPSGPIMTKYVGKAYVADDHSGFGIDTARTLAGTRRKTIFAPSDPGRMWRRQAVLQLVQNHVHNHIVKIGKKHYRQEKGIAQGSVLSSLLCSLLYADLERQRLKFLDQQSSLLLRLIDDFLLITTDRYQAEEFLRAMSDGHQDYGINIEAEKSLANFEITIDGRKIPRLHGTTGFPYCGICVDTRTLEVGKDRRRIDLQIGDSLTIDTHGSCANVFQRRMLTAMRIQLHAVLLDEQLNSGTQILTTLFGCFVETCMKMHQYRVKMPLEKRPSQRKIMELCQKLINLVRRTVMRGDGFQNQSVKQTRLYWLAATSMIMVLRKKQSQYGLVLKWLAGMQIRSSHSMDQLMSGRELDRFVQDAMSPFRAYVY